MQGDQCSGCAHYEGMARCPAFPGGIPAKVMAGAVVHDHVIKGQAEPVLYSPAGSR